MAYTVTVTLNHSAIFAFLYSPAGPIRRRVGQLGNQVQRRAVARAPKDTGRLASSIRVTTGVTFSGSVQGPYADIGSDVEYALWRHEGTGIYGSGRRIRPRRARVLRWRAGRRSSGRQPGVAPVSPWVYRPSVKGTPGVPYLVSALIAVMGPVARIRSFQGRARRRR